MGHGTTGGNPQAGTPKGGRAATVERFQPHDEVIPRLAYLRREIAALHAKIDGELYSENESGNEAIAAATASVATALAQLEAASVALGNLPICKECRSADIAWHEEYEADPDCGIAYSPPGLICAGCGNVVRDDTPDDDALWEGGAA